MADLNEAYQVLSQVTLRRQYDQQLRKQEAGIADEPAPASAAPAPDVSPVAARPRARPSAEILSSFALEFSAQVRNTLLASRRTFSWRERKLEGFDWAVGASFWFSRYYAALRAFATADPAAAQKFINYATLAVSQGRHPLKKNFFLFLLAFQRIYEPETVTGVCRRFVKSGGTAAFLETHTLLILVDVSHQRSLLCGPQLQDERFRKLVQQLGIVKPRGS